MLVSAKVHFDESNMRHNRSLLFRAKTAMPEEWTKRFRKNVRVMNRTPEKSGALRRSIITQAIGNQAKVSWRSPYARAQEYGGHDYPGQYTNYTKEGTGPHFGRKAFAKTNREMPALLRELGLTK